MKLHQDIFRPELITQAFEEERFRNNPEEINTGYCFQWAYMCYIAFNDVELLSVPGHAFVRYKGKYYDSERLNGVSDWKDLPTCRLLAEIRDGFIDNEPYLMTEACFTKEWQDAG